MGHPGDPWVWAPGCGAHPENHRLSRRFDGSTVALVLYGDDLFDFVAQDFVLGNELRSSHKKNSWDVKAVSGPGLTTRHYRGFSYHLYHKETTWNIHEHRRTKNQSMI